MTISERFRPYVPEEIARRESSYWRHDALLHSRDDEILGIRDFLMQQGAQKMHDFAPFMAPIAHELGTPVLRDWYHRAEKFHEFLEEADDVGGNPKDILTKKNALVTEILLNRRAVASFPDLFFPELDLSLYRYPSTPNIKEQFHDFSLNYLKLTIPNPDASDEAATLYARVARLTPHVSEALQQPVGASLFAPELIISGNPEYIAESSDDFLLRRGAEIAAINQRAKRETDPEVRQQLLSLKAGLAGEIVKIWHDRKSQGESGEYETTVRVNYLKGGDKKQTDDLVEIAITDTKGHYFNMRTARPWLQKGTKLARTLRRELPDMQFDATYDRF
jgi:hypothetical protein